MLPSWRGLALLVHERPATGRLRQDRSTMGLGVLVLTSDTATWTPVWPSSTVFQPVGFGRAELSPAMPRLLRVGTAWDVVGQPYRVRTLRRVPT